MDPKRLLLSNEEGREGEIEGLYQQILIGITGGRQPLPLDLVEAQCKVADLWRYARYTEDQTGLNTYLHPKFGVNERRRHGLLHTKEILAIRNYHAQAIRQTVELFEGLRGDASQFMSHVGPRTGIIPLSGGVIPLKKAK